MIIRAIYPMEYFGKSEKEQFNDGYHYFRMAKWDYGKLPEYYETKPYEEVE